MLLNVLRRQLTYQGQAETNAEAGFNIALRPRKPEGSALGRTAQDGYLDFHTAPELCFPLSLFPVIATGPVSRDSRRTCEVLRFKPVVL